MRQEKVMVNFMSPANELGHSSVDGGGSSNFKTGSYMLRFSVSLIVA